MRIGIIGSGIGGLSLGVRLQAVGHKVTILEARNAPGGRAGRIVSDGYTFDTGPSVVTLPDTIREVFAVAGRRLDDVLDLVPLDPFYRLYFPNGAWFDYNGHPDAMKAEIGRFSPSDAAQYDAFFRHTGDIYRKAVLELGDQPFLHPSDFLSIVPAMLRLRALRPVHSTVASYFRDPHIRRAFSFQPLFIGGSPFRTPSIYAMFPYLERAGGVHFVRGGMYRLIEALCALFQEIGGSLQLDSPVQGIEVDGRRASGIRTESGIQAFDTVVSNADVGATLNRLLPSEANSPVARLRAGRYRYSMSCFLLFLGTNRQFPALRHHTIFFSRRYRELIADIVERQRLPPDASMYVHAPMRTDPTMAPAGGDSLFILAPVPNLAGNTNWRDIETSYGDELIRILEQEFGLAGLRASIIFRRTLAPDLYFRDELRSTLGNAFQLQPLLSQSAYFRPHARHPRIGGLYQVGAGTHPGSGVPGVLLSSRMVANLIGPAG